jgi:hypothetical protein
MTENDSSWPQKNDSCRKRTRRSILRSRLLRRTGAKQVFSQSSALSPFFCCLLPESMHRIHKPGELGFDTDYFPIGGKSQNTTGDAAAGLDQIGYDFRYPPLKADVRH